MTPRLCDHCGRICGDFRGGHGSLTKGGATFHFCHPNELDRPDCYRLVTVFHEPIGSRKDEAADVDR